MPTVDSKTFERAYAKALAYARARMRGQHWAESDLAAELAQEALTASFDPERYAWRGDKPLEHHVVLVVKSLLSDRADAAKLRKKPENAVAADEALKRPAMPADARVRVRDQQARREARHEWMLSQLVGLALAVYSLYLKDVFDAAEQATILARPIEAIYEARRRVAEVAREAPPFDEGEAELGPDGGDDEDDDDDGDRPVGYEEDTS